MDADIDMDMWDVGRGRGTDLMPYLRQVRMIQNAYRELPSQPDQTVSQKITPSYTDSTLRSTNSSVQPAVGLVNYAAHQAQADNMCK